MKLKQLLNDDDAVSPVIGVILMVAITVILAAVIGTFVLGLGDQVQETSPNAQWSWEQTDVTGDTNLDSGEYQATISHSGGQDIDPATLTLSVDNGAATTYTPNAGNWSSLDGNDEVVAGSEYDVVNMGYDPSADGDTTPEAVALSSGDTVKLLWRSSDGGTSATLTEHDVN